MNIILIHLTQSSQGWDLKKTTTTATTTTTTTTIISAITNFKTLALNLVRYQCYYKFRIHSSAETLTKNYEIRMVPFFQ